MKCLNKKLVTFIALWSFHPRRTIMQTNNTGKRERNHEET